MTFNVRLIADCTTDNTNDDNDGEDIACVSLIAGFSSRDEFEKHEDDGFESITALFESVLQKKHNGYYISGPIGVEDIISNESDESDDDGSDNENDTEDKDHREIVVPDFIV